MDEKNARARNPRIEALRLAAIVGIAVFHTFQPWFGALTGGSWDAGPATRTALGCVSLLGTYGNHVFFLISGFFLIPRAVGAARGDGYWPSQARAVVRRALPILATVALYAAIALAVSSWVTPIEGVSTHETGWLVGGLQFVWVYLAVVVLAPAIGWVWARLSRPRALVATIAVAALLANAYIAFVSPGDEVRSLLEWRKLMSAASYLVAFLVGGALADLDLRPLSRALVPLVLVAVAFEAVAGIGGDLRLLEALSFKSTSALSFLLAVASLARAAQGPGTSWPPLPARGCRTLARSILGFYVAQSMFYALWSPALTQLTAASLPYGEGAFLATGVVASIVLLALFFAFDQLVRLPALRLARLA